MIKEGLVDIDDIDMLLNSDLPYQHKLRSIYELCNKQMKEYIRFGEIPKDEKSKIGNGCIGDGYEACFINVYDMCRWHLLI